MVYYCAESISWFGSYIKIKIWLSLFISNVEPGNLQNRAWIYLVRVWKVGKGGAVANTSDVMLGYLEMEVELLGL